MKENLLSFKIGWYSLHTGQQGIDHFFAKNEKEAIEQVLSWNNQQEGHWNFWLEEKLDTPHG